jgi:hypothetical protein
MNAENFNALIAHIEKETQCFKRHYKLYGDVYFLRNSTKTESLEFRFIRSNIVSIKKYKLIKDEANRIIDEALTHESTYTFNTVQSVKILNLLESIC